MSSGFFDPKYGLGGESAWYGRGLARGLAFTQEQAAEALDLGSDYSGGLFSYFARPAEQALRQRAAALREWSQTPEYASGLERFGEGATEIAATLPAYIAATQVGGVIPGLAAMGYLRGRPEGRGLEEAAIEGTLGAVFGATEPLSRLPRAAINALTGAKLLEPEEGYQEPIDFLAPAVVGGFSALPKAVPRAREVGGRRSAGGEQPGSVESPLPPATLLTNEDQLTIARMIQSEQIDAKGAMIARIERLKPFSDVDPAAKAEIRRLEKTLNLVEAGARDPRADYRGERSAFVQRQMDDRGLSEMEATENWRNVISERIEDAPELGLEPVQARVSEVTDQINTVRTMKPIELYEAGLLGDQVTPRPKAKKLGNQKKKLLRTLSDRLERVQELEKAESRLAVLRDDLSQFPQEKPSGASPEGSDPVSQEPFSAAMERQIAAPNKVGVRDTPGSEPPIQEVPLVQRQPWTLTRSEEATLQGVSEDVIRALERAPKPGPDRVNAKGEKLPPLSYGGPMARNLPAATEQEITMLKLAGFMDKDGFLTAKGEETLAGRRKRFDDNRRRLQQGEAVPAQVLLEWPDQMERAARVDQTARKRGGNRPGSSESDNLTVDDLRLAEDDTIRNRRQLDEQRGRDFLEDERNKELTTRRLSAEQEIRIQDAAVELSEMAGFDLVPSKERPFYEQVMDLINSDRIPLIGIADVLERNGLSLADFADAYGLTVRESAQTLARQRQMGARIARQYGVKRLDDVAKVLEVSRPRRELLKERLSDPNLSSADRKALEWELSSGYLTKNEIKTLKEMGVDRDMVMGKGLWRRLENARRGLLVIQFSTAMRNLLTSVGNVTVSMMNEANERAIRGFVRGTGAVTGSKAIQDYGKSIHPVRGFENLVRIFQETGARVAGRDGSKIVSDVLNMFPNEADTLVSSFNSDIATIQANRVKRSGAATEAAHRVVDRLEATSNVLNTLNRFQEHVIRRAAFRAELERQVKMNPIVIRDKTYSSLRQLEADNLLGKLPQRMVQNAVDRGLSMTWSGNFDKNGAVAPLIDFVNRVPVASWMVPFPRFTANAIQWQLEHSPAGILRYASEQQRNNFLAGDISGIAKMMTGSTLMMYALDMANSENSTGDWNLYKDLETGELLDLNPFQPFASYAFWAHVLTRSMQPRMSPETADLANLGINILSGPTGLAYNFIRQALGKEAFEQFKSQEGDPVKLRRLSFPDIVRGIGAGNMRSGLGLYAIDKLIADGFTEKSLPVAPFEGYTDIETGGTVYPQDIDVPLRGSSRSSGSALGDFVGGFAANYFGSYLTGLGDIMNAYKEYKSWEGDLDASNVGNPIAFQEVEDPLTGQVSRMPYDGFVDNLTNSFEESFKARFPMAFDSRPIYIPTQEDPIRTYRPGAKTATGVIYKQPMNYAQELASDFDLTQSDILPSTGNPVWDDLVKEKIGQYIEPYVIAYVKNMGDDEKYPASAAREEYFEGLTYSNKILYLKDRFAAAANEARRDARREAPLLWDQVDKSRKPPLEVQAARERAAQMQGRAMGGEQQ